MRILSTIILLIFLHLSEKSVDQQTYVANSDVYVRGGIGTSHEILGVIKSGDDVNILDISNDKWFKVQLKEEVGYVSSKFLSVKEKDGHVSEISEPIAGPTEDKSPNHELIELGIIFFVFLLITLFFVVEISRNSKKKKSILDLGRIDDKHKGPPKVQISSGPTVTAPINIDDKLDLRKAISEIIAQLNQPKSIAINGTTQHSGKTQNINQLVRDVPNWKEPLVVSADAFNTSTNEQKLFYGHYKYQFLSGICLELKGNANYARLLHFDLIQEYEIHKDVETLEKQLSRLKSFYPETAFNAIELIKRIPDEIKTEVDNRNKIEQYQSPTSLSNDFVVDLTDETTLALPEKENVGMISMPVPDWPHQYIYSIADFDSASPEQIDFYRLFKQKFQEGICMDIKGNTNYAFILLFDLLENYKIHNDLEATEKQLARLGNCYYKTRYYGLKFLEEIKRKLTPIPQIPNMRLQRLNEPSERSIPLHQSEPEYIYWKIGSKYKEKLGLNAEEVLSLNKLWEGSNNFTAIEYCNFQVIRLYLNVLKEFKKLCTMKGLTSEEVVVNISDLVARLQFRYRKGSSNYNMSLKNTSDLLHAHIFKLCENRIRELYGHKRKLNLDSLFSDQRIMVEFDSKMLVPIAALLNDLEKNVPEPDEATQIELNSLNSTRWKSDFAQICERFDGDLLGFVDSIIALGALNQKNQSVEDIFFEASKFTAPNDSESALILYLYYLHYDLKSIRFDNKPLTKTIQKVIFKNPDQVSQFELIVSKFLNDKNLENAIEAIRSIYTTKRKRITLDKVSIEEVRKRHAGTVELLNEYLEEEESLEEHFATTTSTVDSTELRFTINQDQSILSAFLTEIHLEEIHYLALRYFVKNNLSVATTDFEEFSRNHGVFTNHLIDSINEACYETLDDILIEEADEFYTIEPAYFQTISAK